MASSSIARWETDTVEPGYSTLRRVLQACGFDIPPVLVPYERDPERDAQVQELQDLNPQARMERYLARLEKRRPS
jgi:transcriptional regulator with XRE-family HTH domain